MGIEPTPLAWEAKVLPLYYTREICCLLCQIDFKGASSFDSIHRFALHTIKI